MEIATHGAVVGLAVAMSAGWIGDRFGVAPAGVSGDAVAHDRDVLTGKGLGRFFGHGWGEGDLRHAGIQKRKRQQKGRNAPECHEELIFHGPLFFFHDNHFFPNA